MAQPMFEGGESEQNRHPFALLAGAVALAATVTIAPPFIAQGVQGNRPGEEVSQMLPSGVVVTEIENHRLYHLGRRNGGVGEGASKCERSQVMYSKVYVRSAPGGGTPGEPFGNYETCTTMLGKVTVVSVPPRPLPR